MATRSGAGNDPTVISLILSVSVWGARHQGDSPASNRQRGGLRLCLCTWTQREQHAVLLVEWKLHKSEHGIGLARQKNLYIEIMGSFLRTDSAHCAVRPYVPRH